MAKSTIELNGKIYDISTGMPIVDKAKQVNAQRKASLESVRPSNVAQKITIETHRKAHALAKSAKKVHKRQQRAKVLIRAAVKPPIKKTIEKAYSKVTEIPKASANSALDRARQIQKSDKISRFGAKPSRQTVAARVHQAEKKVAVKPEPAQVIQQPETKPKEHKSKRKHAKRVSWVLSSVAALAVVGYVVYLNLPNLAMKVAAVRAGFSANLPSYSPSGFKLKGPISYSPGQITIAYHSNNDQREYHITQKESSWDSESLLTNYVTSQPDYQTYRDHGLTIYMFGSSNATWVNSGVWYTIEGASQLSAEQIVKIAASL